MHEGATPRLVAYPGTRCLVHSGHLAVDIVGGQQQRPLVATRWISDPKARFGYVLPKVRTPSLPAIGKLA